MTQHDKRSVMPPTPSPAKPGQAGGNIPVRGRNLDEFRNDLIALFARARGQATRPGS